MVALGQVAFVEGRVSISPDLLWRAWPDGYLAVRGVQTVGDWHCVDVGAGGEGTSLWSRSTPDSGGLTELGLLEGMPDARVNAGLLLPCADPGDAATWACLLRDLAEAVNVRVAHEKGKPDYAFFGPGGFAFWRSFGPDDYWHLAQNNNFWTFQLQRENPQVVHNYGQSWTPRSEDPAEVLVWLRIAEREMAERRQT